MNVLILTPDGVGSTILQRITTLALHLTQKDVINCHELTNGLIIKNNKIYKDFSLGYSQTLDDVINLLQQSEFSLVSRLAKYHLDNRKDDLNSQKKFYNFLKNFNDKILICRRKNIFEYAMSWSIREKSKVFNVYQKKHRVAVREIDSVNPSFFLKKCEEYVRYAQWIEEKFKDYNHDVVYYEDFATDPDKEIKRIFNINNIFENTFGEKLGAIFQIEYLVSNRRVSLEDRSKFKPLIKYKKTMLKLEKQQILPAGIAAPIKNTSLEDKKKMINNFEQCQELFYNFARQHNWIDISKINYDFWNKKNI
jgi:hypothetical protein